MVALTGCGQMLPETAADGSSWNEDWVTVGSVLGVDTPAGLTPRENNEALAAKGMYYATWSIGEASDYVNEEGEEAELYDAQVYVLLAGYDAAEKAEESMEKWLAIASSQYAVTQTYSGTYNGQPFTVLTYTYTSQTNPFAGVAGTDCLHTTSPALRATSPYTGEAFGAAHVWGDCCFAATPRPPWFR